MSSHARLKQVLPLPHGRVWRTSTPSPNWQKGPFIYEMTGTSRLGGGRRRALIWEWTDLHDQHGKDLQWGRLLGRESSQELKRLEEV
jgi:hypothetical protein